MALARADSVLPALPAVVPTPLMALPVGGQLRHPLRPVQLGGPAAHADDVWPGPPVTCFFVPGPLPGLNELIDAAKSGRGKGNAYSRLKRSWTDTVILMARAAQLPKCQRARFSFRWQERNRKRDPDNVAAGGRKLVLDGLVKAGVLPGDGWEHVASWDDTFEVATRPGVLVGIYPIV